GYRINKSCNKERDDTKDQHAESYFHGSCCLGIVINKVLSLPKFERINPFCGLSFLAENTGDSN
ncbi:hypothetical protein, partial [Parasutterella excrementihominis]|uniref:hypothetical protein n=1 Tax=Parasutterella excrementihominis TaxID=487175 RepID=UPI0025B02B0A